MGAVVEAVRVLPSVGEVLVIDDGSTDETADRARAAGARVLGLPFNSGVGAAMRTAFLFALRNGFDTVVQVDADGQHPADQIDQLLAGLESADVVIGSRFAADSDMRVPAVRRSVMRVLSFTLSRVTGEKLTDTTSGFRAFGPAAVRLFARAYPYEYLGDTVEATVIAARAGLRVTEVPVVMRERQGGVPSQGPVKSTLYVGRAMLALGTGLARKRGTGEVL